MITIKEQNAWVLTFKALIFDAFFPLTLEYLKADDENQKRKK